MLIYSMADQPRIESAAAQFSRPISDTAGLVELVETSRTSNLLLLVISQFPFLER